MTLAEYLSSRALTHSAFAERIGVSQASVTRYSIGRRIPRPKVLAKIKKATEGAVTADDFMAQPGSKAA